MDPEKTKYSVLPCSAIQMMAKWTCAMLIKNVVKKDVINNFNVNVQEL